MSLLRIINHPAKNARWSRLLTVLPSQFVRHNATASIAQSAEPILPLSGKQGTFTISHGQSAYPDKPVRVNEVGIQQLSSELQQKLFPHAPYITDPQLVALSRKHLSIHELLGKQSAIQPPIDFPLPALQGRSLDEHFYQIGKDAAEPYLSMSTNFAKVNLPDPPTKWVQRSGWTRYGKDGSVESVAAPLEDCLVFDCEVLYKESPFPVMACAASTEAWYGWVSPWLLSESESPRHLIPFGSEADRPRILIGHNVGYDRQRIQDEYAIRQTKNAFIDTMSLHVAVNGMCSRQRPTWMKHQKQKLMKEKLSEEASSSLSLSELLGTMEDDEISELWIARSSINSLRDVAQFHCNIKLDKSVRDYFGELDRAGIVERFGQLMDYCATDVTTTHKVYKAVLPGFLDVCPHPVSFAAMLRLSSVFLPVDKSWESYIENAESTYLKLSADVQARLKTLAENALEVRNDPEKYTNDPWLNQLDWSGQEIRMLKPKKKGDVPQQAKNQKKPGMPQWYKALFPTNYAPMNLTVRTRIAPLLLRLAWEGNPLVWSDKYGWVFRVTNQSDREKFEAKHFTMCDMSDETVMKIRMDHQGVFFKVPHKDGPTKRVANVMAKGYLTAFEEGTLSSEFPYAKEALDMNAACSYWISARERIKSQMVVWNTDTDMGLNGQQSNGLGMILPQIIPMGTITRRAVENTWLTASNAKKNRVGSELKAMVKAPQGFKFVGADVDSEELWIASLFGDAEFGIHGATAIGWMTLEGTKAAGTDLHSKTAKILGISRNDAKIFNYGRIYGAGLKFAIQLLHQFNPAISDTEAERVATELYESTKGQKSKSKSLNDGRPFWRGGTESVVFNKLEAIAEQDVPRTPVLACAITEALMQRYINKGGFMPSRINWAIQSSGVDYLHLLIVSMEYLIRSYGINARLSITVHDEIRYLVTDEDAYRAAMALQISNLWTRAMFSQQVGLNDVPQGVAFFSAVDVDHVLRKEVNMDCITPSHPTPIPHGESLDIYQLLSHPKAALGPHVDRDQLRKKWLFQPRKPVLAGARLNLDFLDAQISRVEKRSSPVRKARAPKTQSKRQRTVVEEFVPLEFLEDVAKAPTKVSGQGTQKATRALRPLPLKVNASQQMVK